MPQPDGPMQIVQSDRSLPPRPWYRLSITRKWPELLKDLPDSSPHLSNEALGAFRLLGRELLHVAVPLFLRLCQSTLHVLTVPELQASSQHLASRSMKEPIRLEDKTCTMPSTNTWSHRWPSPHHGSPQYKNIQKRCKNTCQSISVPLPMR